MTLAADVVNYYEQLLALGLPGALAADLTLQYQQFIMARLLAGPSAPPDEPDMGFLEMEKHERVSEPA